MQAIRNVGSGKRVFVPLKKENTRLRRQSKQGLWIMDNNEKKMKKNKGRKRKGKKTIFSFISCHPMEQKLDLEGQITIKKLKQKIKQTILVVYERTNKMKRI